jgi:peptidoglycan/xylan/chitin deacetylase (PgdA/CDA1 family)
MQRRLLLPILLSAIFLTVALPNTTSTITTTSSRIVITFDDVGKENYVWENAYPILQQYGFKAVAYCTVESLNASMITNLKMLVAKGWEIGSHSMTHPLDLTLLSGDKLLYEILNSKILLEQYFGTSVTSFAYPHSTTSSSVINVIQQYYHNARTSSWWAWQSSVWNNSISYEIPSISIANSNYAYNIPTAINMAKASGKTVVLLFHKVVSAGDSASITPGNFSWCIQQISESKIPVAKIQELTP